MVEGFDLLVLYLQDFRERKFNLCLHLTSKFRKMYFSQAVDVWRRGTATYPSQGKTFNRVI